MAYLNFGIWWFCAVTFKLYASYSLCVSHYLIYPVLFLGSFLSVKAFDNQLNGAFVIDMLQDKQGFMYHQQ